MLGREVEDDVMRKCDLFFKEMEGTVKAAEWAYDFTIQNLIRLFVLGRIPASDIGSYFDAFARYWHSKIPETVRNAEPLNAVMDFIAIFASIPAGECNNLRTDSFKELCYGISRLEFALKDSDNSPTSEGSSGVTENLERLTGKVAGHTVIAFCHDKHHSRILYNQYKHFMSRHQQQGCELVLKGLLSADKVLQSESEYKQTVKQIIADIVNAQSNFVDLISKKIEEGYRNDNHMMKNLIKEIDLESSDGLEVHITSDDENSQAKSTAEMTEEVNDTMSNVSSQENHVPKRKTPLKRKLPPSLHSNNHQKYKAVPNANSRMRDDTKLMPPPLFAEKSRSQHIPSRKQVNIKPPEMSIVFRKAGDDSGNKSVISTSTSYSTRVRHSFTQLQDAYIIFGMIKYRNKKQLWCEIRKKYPFPEYRTPTHLKDRWRTLLKRGDVHLEGEKIVAVQKYEAILKHLYTKYEKDNKWEWKNQKSSKRRLITLDEDEIDNDISIDDCSDDDDLQQQQSSTHNTILQWLNSNSDAPEQEAEPPVPSANVIEIEKPETSGTFVKSHVNGESTHFSDEEAPPNTGQVILQPSKSTEYIENVHGKLLPNSHNKKSTDQVDVNATNLRDRNNTFQRFSDASAPVEHRKPEVTTQSSSVQDNVNVTDHNNPDHKATAEESTHENHVVPVSQPIGNNSIEKEPEIYFNSQDLIEIIDAPQEGLSKASKQPNQNINKPPADIHKYGNTAVCNTCNDKDGEKSDRSMSFELLNLGEQSLHCELMREEDISFISTDSDNSVVKTSKNNSNVATTENLISTVLSNNDAELEYVTQNNIDSEMPQTQGHSHQFETHGYPASPSTYRTVSPATSSEYMTAGEDSESDGDRTSNEKTLCGDEQTSNFDEPHHMDSSSLSEAARKGINDAPQITTVHSTRTNCAIPRVDLIQSDTAPRTSTVEKSGGIRRTTAASLSGTQQETGKSQMEQNSVIQQYGSDDNVAKGQNAGQNSLPNCPEKHKKSHAAVKMQELHNIRTRRQTAKIREESLNHSRTLRSSLRHESRQPFVTLGKTKVKNERKRLHSHDDKQNLNLNRANQLNSSEMHSRDCETAQNIVKYRRKERRFGDPGAPLKLSKEDEAWLNDDQASSINPDAFIAHGKSKQGPRKKWSDTEDNYLVEGVKKYGEGSWKKILENCKFFNRTAVNLKDRYRVLKQNHHDKISKS